MVFCCIAIVAIAIIYFCVLWLRQIFSFLRRDRTHPSPLPAPPRALACLGALPVYGHTFLFQKWAGECVKQFQPEMTEITCLPPSRFNRRLGNCFAVYIWGQWRVCIQGQALAEQVIEHSDLEDAFPWTPPIMLLGKSCLPFLEERDAEQLRMLVEQPLSHAKVLPYASSFAEMAEKCLEEILTGKFKRSTRRRKKGSANDVDPDSSFTDPDHLSDQEEETDLDVPQSKIKWEAFRSYTFDLIDGPVLGMNQWLKPSESEQPGGEPTQQEVVEDETEGAKKDPEITELPQRDRMLLWMERMKAGVDVIKLTFGPEWMRIWLLNEYGRALNGRMHVHEVISKHVENMSRNVPVEHRPGHAYHDPTTQLIPLLTLRDNFQREREGIFGTPSLAKVTNRSRSFSAPAVSMSVNVSSVHVNENGDLQGKRSAIPDLIPPFTTEQDLARPRYESSPALRHRKVPETPVDSPSMRNFRHQLELLNPPAPKSEATTTKVPQISILESLMRQQDHDGNGISRAVMSELAISLWMMMDASNAWTAVALALLAANNEACSLVHEELDELIRAHGRDNLYEARVMSKMKYTDALLYEAIRLSPSFLGGLKRTTTTIELHDVGVQLPKGTHIFFSAPTEMVFDIHKSCGCKPEELGNQYPSVELHGFLPFQGLEVPLMVLQCKVFLIVLLQQYSPTMSKKRTFIRRVRAAIDKSIQGMNRSRSHSPVRDLDIESGVHTTTNCSCRPNGESKFRLDVGRLFAKIPFPEPRRVISIRPRDDYWVD